MFKQKSFNILLACIALIIISAVLKYLDPGIPLFDGGLIIVIFLTSFLKRDFYTLLFGAVSLALIGIAVLYPHEGIPLQQVVQQQLFSALVLVVTVVAVVQMKRLYRSIESDERQVTALFEHATEGIVLTNQQGKIVLVNPAALRLFNYEREELLGKPIETLLPMRFHAMHVHDRGSFYKHPSNRTMGHGRDLFAKTKDGREFPVEVSLSYYQEKNEFFVIGFVVDITERKKAEQELLAQKTQLEKITADIRKLNADLETKVEERTLILKEALQELERSQLELNEALNKEKELNEIKSRFVSMASHEFRTPLSTILSSATLISKYVQAEEQEKRDKHTRRIRDSVKHLNNLLEDFLSLGKLEEGHIKPSASPFRVDEFMEEVVDEMRPMAKAAQVIHTRLEGNEVFCTDKRLLKNILLNLVGNAVKFSPEGSPVWLNIHNTEASLVLSVRDEGLGIAEEDQQHLFSSFFRGRNVVNIEGTGLGLHIVKRYVELLGGEVRLQSALGAGTTITVVLPLLPEKEA